MLKVFVSYSRADAEFISKLVNDLSDLGIDVLLDKKHLRGGRSTVSEIRAKIGQSDYLVPVMTGNSVRSKWVRPVEIAWALKLQKEGRRLRILPLLLKDSRSKFVEVEDLNYIDFRNDYGIGLARLVQSLPNPEYDEIANLRKELDEEKIEERSLLSILRRVATRPRKSGRRPNWSDLSAKQFMREIRRVVKDDKLVNDIYWWLIVYGALRFKNIERFWDKKDVYQNSVRYAKIAPRGTVLMDDLSTEHVDRRSTLAVRRSSSRARTPKRRASHK